MELERSVFLIGNGAVDAMASTSKGSIQRVNASYYKERQRNWSGISKVTALYR